MKGHTTIELTDINTGKKDIYEDDNMMTKALEYYFANGGYVNALNNDKNNMVEELLGGILLFDGTIEENVETVYAPSGLHMIANGSVGTVSNDDVTELGSYNSTESGWQEDGSYVQVYDFTADQANGTIACCCLTSKSHGYAGEGNSTSKVAKTTGISETGLVGTQTAFGTSINDANILRINYTDSTITIAEPSGSSVTLKTYRIPLSIINLTQTMSNLVLVKTETLTLPVEGGDYSDFQCTCTDYEGNGYLVYYTLSTTKLLSSDNTIRIVKIKKDNSMEYKSVYALTLDEIAGAYNMVIQDGYILFDCYVKGSTSTSEKKYLININTLDTKLIDVYNRTKQNSNTGVTMWRNSEGIYYTNNGYKIDLINGEAYPLNNTYSNLYRQHMVQGNPLMSVSLKHSSTTTTTGYYLKRHTDYIASINNLETPVTKTADKSMKVTYRITF